MISQMSDEQLTCAVNEEVMGWEPDDPWQPAIRPDHWWIVVVKMEKLGWRCGMNNYDGPWEVEFVPLKVNNAGRIGAHFAVNDGIGRAVLEAALAARRGMDNG